jgi:hypothetical protein
MYGYSKHLFDLWALRQGVTDRVAGLKFFNVYGPREDHKGDMRSVVHKSYGQIQATGEVKLFKSYKPEYRDGEQVRDFVYVKDAVDVCLWLHDNQRASGIFNVGTGTARTWLDLTNAVFSAMGKPPRIQFIDMPETLRPKYQYHTCADIGACRPRDIARRLPRWRTGCAITCSRGWRRPDSPDVIGGAGSCLPGHTGACPSGRWAGSRLPWARGRQRRFLFLARDSAAMRCLNEASFVCRPASPVARMLTASKPALRPLPMDTVATGTPAGICTIESSESIPLSALDSIGTPITARWCDWRSCRAGGRHRRRRR